MDEIGALELRRRGGLRPSLELALGALGSVAGPRALVCGAREDCAEELRVLAEAAGLEASVLTPPDAAAAAAIVLRALGAD
jgi:hypothetical protein